MHSSFGKIGGIAVALIAGVLAGCQGSAQPPGTSPVAPARLTDVGARTVEKVRERGVLNCGITTGIPGWAFKDDRGEWDGYDVAICRALAAAVLGDPMKVAFQSTTGKTRFNALRSGDVDILVRNTTWTYSRDVTLGFEFTVTNYFEGQGILLSRRVGGSSLDALDGASICLPRGTTTELNAKTYLTAHGIDVDIVPVGSFREARVAYDEGRCDALSTDQSGLAVTRAVSQSLARDTVLDAVFSREPLTPLVRQGDDHWAAIVKATIWMLMAAEEAGLTAETVNQADHALLDDADNLAMDLGLSPGWARRAVGASGNFGEIHDRTIGAGTKIGLRRGLNETVKNGGLVVAPRFDGDLPPAASRYSGQADAIVGAGRVRCGVATQHEAFDRAMCAILATALFDDETAAEITVFPSEDAALAGLAGRGVDVVGGVTVSVPRIAAGYKIPTIVHFAETARAMRGPAVLGGDPIWEDLVGWAAKAPVIAAELGLSSTNLDPGASPEANFLVGRDGQYLRELGLRRDAYRDVVRTHGNILEIHARTGVSGPFNRLWKDGGILQGQPFR